MLYETKFLISAGITCAVEVPVLLCGKIFFERGFLKKKKTGWFLWIFTGCAASLLTIPYLWFVFTPYFDKSHYVLFGEAAVTIFEALFYMVFLRIPLWKVLIISCMANLMSFLFGVYFL